jgi:glyoxylase-like metal-dependent hydrolase (beta-lactamase superfamily II)
VGCSVLLAGPAAAAEPQPAPAAAERISSELEAIQLTAGAWVIVHEQPFPANSLLVEAADGTLVLCATPYTAEATAELLRWIEGRHGRRRIIAINPHFHADALGGNPALRAAGVETHGSDLTVRMLAERGQKVREQVLSWLEGRPELQERFRKAEWLPPQHVFPAAEGKVLHLGADRVRIHYPGPSHSPDLVVVHFPRFPRQRILYGGCMIGAGPRLGNTADADLEHWPQAVRDLQQFDVDHVVPGHGSRYDPGLLQHTLQLLQAH